MHFISKSDSTDVAAASDHIVALRERKENLESAADEARAVLAERRQYKDSADTIAAFAQEMSEFLLSSFSGVSGSWVGDCHRTISE